jgi:NAD(P)-dependent dehydrogenase (short-subunit alcohol dehydrogenase family)
MPSTTSLIGKVCIVTGANGGIGRETALGLAQMGAHVVMVCRNVDRGKMALEDVRRESGNSKVDLLIGDMSSQASVRELAKQTHEKYSRVDVLINNAGGGTGAGTVSADRIEYTLATNHLGPALLTVLLLDLLKASAPSRVINVSSEAHKGTKDIDVHHLPAVEPNFRSRIQAYGRSKLLMNAYTLALAAKLEGTGVTCNCLHPGVVATNIFGKPKGVMKVILALLRPFMLNLKQGAVVSLWAATAPELANVSGKYFVKSKEAESSQLSRDPSVQAEIWDWTQKLIGQPLP